MGISSGEVPTGTIDNGSDLKGYAHGAQQELLSHRCSDENGKPVSVQNGKAINQRTNCAVLAFKDKG